MKRVKLVLGALSQPSSHFHRPKCFQCESYLQLLQS
ncbi:hypothetical protein OIU74_026580 [Salix koriyanagi]|uniref:Uncharacterized protein n=1 Tax=Salix koriyanagi TaxID=2511006 RepID=A0A9Q0VZP9_9ROSI|nr:hypothetical protein OIU74_026580 [Salix koriyanagi]